MDSLCKAVVNTYGRAGVDLFQAHHRRHRSDVIQVVLCSLAASSMYLHSLSILL